ncbi:2',3'-cyclic-nucleotide 3'-phosphodiesterase [Lanmaoa asiatica]|nr:2',3'-cyclic-nucleotide 3'-phosphodiesterase [Lanmaoa asiatica]
MGVSLWLVPAAVQMDMIKSGLPRCPSIDQPLSPSSYPAILPHITLATVPFSDPGIQDVLLDAVPENQQSIRAHFQSLVVGDHYFRSVFIDIQPTQELVGFQDQILTHLRRRGLEPSAPRFPHMSLCYITDEDGGERDRTAQALRETSVISRTCDTQSISLQCGDASLPGFDGAEVWMVNCEGPVETWEVGERKVKLTLKS